MWKYRIIEERNGFALVALAADTKRATVVRIGRKNQQVFSAMPGDMPDDGGWLFAALSDTGIDYVSKLYSRGYARRCFRKLAGPALVEPDYDAIVSVGADD